MKGWQRFLAMVWWFPLVPVVVYIALFYLFLTLFLKCLFAISPAFVVGPGPFAGPLTEIAEALAAIVAMWLLFRFFEKRSIRQSGFDTTRAGMDLVCGFVFGLVLVSFVVMFDLAFGVYKFSGFNSGFNPLSTLIIFFFAALTEEVIFRGFLFQMCEKRLGVWPAFAITCFLFGLAHMLNDVHGATFGMKLLGSISLMLEAGIVLNAAFLVRRTLWLPLGLHWAWNFFEGPIYGMPVSGANLGTPMLMAKLQGPDVLTGGYFGPEGSVAGVLFGTIGGALMLWYAVRRGQVSENNETPQG